MPSKMVTDRQKSAAAVHAAAETHATAVHQSRAALLAPFLHPSQQMPDLRLVQLLLGRLIASRSTGMVAADEAHLAELRDDADPRRQRDVAAAAVHDALTLLRRGGRGDLRPRQRPPDPSWLIAEC